MANFNPNQPRNEDGEWTIAGSAAWKAAGLQHALDSDNAWSRDPEITREETVRMMREAYMKIPLKERMRSAAKRVVVFDDARDVFQTAEKLGYTDEVDPDSTEIKGFYDFDSHTIYTSAWDGYRDSPENFYHEFAHSIFGYEEKAIKPWIKAFFPEIYK